MLELSERGDGGGENILFDSGGGGKTVVINLDNGCRFGVGVVVVVGDVGGA